jgi:hypothetical protein
MKIAVLVYGRLQKCVEHYSNILETIGNNNEIDFFLSSDNSSESLLSDFIHLYKPILYNNNPIYFDYNLQELYPGNPHTTNNDNMTRHFINKNRVVSLLDEYINKENVHYDIVISLRIDVIFNNKFIFDDLEDNTIYIPLDNDFCGGINDQIAYGKLDVMRKYNYINVIDLLEKKLTVAHPENLTLVNILYNNLSIKRVNLQYFLDK